VNTRSDSNKKSVLMVLQSEFPPDIRIEKEAKTLIQHGYDVHLLCNSYSDRQYVTEECNGIKVHRLPGISKLEKINKIVNIPFPGNPRWIKFIKKYIRRIKPDVLHVHDLPLMITAIRLGRKYGIPVVFDRHEDYPEALRMWNQKGILAKTIKHPSIITKIEKYSIRQADHIIVVVDEAKEKLIDMGTQENKVSVVSNTVDESDYLEPEKQEEDQLMTIVYTGTFSPSRGLETAVEGMAEIKTMLPGSRLVLVGDGADKSVKRNLKERAHELNLENDVVFTGWSSRDVMWGYIRKASVCIVPQPSHPFTDNTIPHKLFEYMLYGKPVVVSDAKPLKRIVEECQCGAVFKSKSPKSFAQAVMQCYENKEVYGKNGKVAVKRKYNWGSDADVLLSVYEQLLNTNNGEM